IVSISFRANTLVERTGVALNHLTVDQVDSATRVMACSPFLVNALQRDPGLIDFMQGKDASPDRLQQALDSVDLSQDEAAFMHTLRQFRNREMARLAWRDLAGVADLYEVMQTLSALADGLSSLALQWGNNKLGKVHGKPVGRDSGNEIGMVVLGLGKLGGGELNFSSDIDLMFVYAEEGETDGGRRISNHEYFTKLGRLYIKLLGEGTSDGFVFRVDMRLRPNGNSGPLALSFDAMEHYYQTHGRDWERYALIKMRPIAGDIDAGNELIAALRPFVYRKYLDFGAVDSIREMKQLINQELKKKGIENNVKLGPGGIREIEFIGQSFQLIRGGRDRNLQQRSILKVLPLLVKNGQLTQQGLGELELAYDFLRRTEHRLQMIADRQTHVLPTDEIDRARVALGMGFESWEDFLAAMQHHMRKVHDHFSQVFTASETEAPTTEAEPELVRVWRGLVDEEQAQQILAAHGYQQPEEARRLLEGLRGGRAYVAFSSAGRERMDRLLPLLIAAAGLTEDANTTLTRLVKLIELIGRRSSYFVLLIENPLALSQLVKLCAASAWIADWISQHPVVMDELIDAASLYQSPDIERLRNELVQRLGQIDAEDLEAQMSTLREFHHAQVLRVAAAELGPGLEPEEIGSRLSDIAEVILQASLDIASATMVSRHGYPDCSDDSKTPFIVIAYGKLGSRELGYSSDLDLAFLYGDCKAGAATDGDKPIAGETFFARLGQRLIHILNTRTAAGNLYEVDMRLRPSGQSGALVTSTEGFEKYQLERAWVWEHQALVRARTVAGSENLQKRFSAIRQKVLCQARDANKLRSEILDMRNKMREAQATTPEGEFNLKHDAGGIVDIEFMVQYGVLLLANQYPELVESTNNYELLSRLARAGFLDEVQRDQLQSTYHYFLGLEYQRKLIGKPSLVPLTELNQSPEPVLAIWQQLFEET
ncbi:MAG: bifunctional [glutamate--ammonia ligase]-adenylyl-L-tyrosine phosphorylase/[glutamate--ammonia-ligase] adenylyltransferase, partial [Acidiferrobacterales bacterium]